MDVHRRAAQLHGGSEAGSKVGGKAPQMPAVVQWQELGATCSRMRTSRTVTQQAPLLDIVIAHVAGVQMPQQPLRNLDPCPRFIASVSSITAGIQNSIQHMWQASKRQQLAAEGSTSHSKHAGIPLYLETQLC